MLNQTKPSIASLALTAFFALTYPTSGFTDGIGGVGDIGDIGDVGDVGGIGADPDGTDGGTGSGGSSGVSASVNANLGLFGTKAKARARARLGRKGVTAKARARARARLGRNGVTAKANAKVDKINLNAAINIGRNAKSKRSKQPTKAVAKPVTTIEDAKATTVKQQIKANQLVGLVMWSSDKQPLGIVQDARPAARGFEISVQANPALGIEKEQITVVIASVKTTPNGIVIGTTAEGLKTLID